MRTQEAEAVCAAMFQFVTHLFVAMLDPPQNRIVAVQLFWGVKGSMAVPALAGYTRTACGIAASWYSVLVL